MGKKTKYSEIWKHVSEIPEKKAKKCNSCDVTYKESTATTTIWNHLEKVHGIKKSSNNEITPLSSEPKEPENTVRAEIAKKSTQISLPKMMKKKTKLTHRVAKMTSVDGFTFRQVAESEFIQESLEMMYGQRVKSPSTVSKYTVDFAEEKVAEFKEIFEKIFQSGKRVSTDCDEFSAPQNTRFMTVNVHTNKDTYNLGMIHVPGPLPAPECKRIYEERLTHFGIGKLKL